MCNEPEKDFETRGRQWRGLKMSACAVGAKLPLELLGCPFWCSYLCPKGWCGGGADGGGCGVGVRGCHDNPNRRHHCEYVWNSTTDTDFKAASVVDTLCATVSWWIIVNVFTRTDDMPWNHTPLLSSSTYLYTPLPPLPSHPFCVDILCL